MSPSMRPYRSTAIRLPIPSFDASMAPARTLEPDSGGIIPARINSIFTPISGLPSYCAIFRADPDKGVLGLARPIFVFPSMNSLSSVSSRQSLP